MPGFGKAATIVLAGGAIVGAGALFLLPAADGARRALPLTATIRMSDLPPAPCKQQIWPNTDRACQTWTTPKREIANVLSAQAADRNVVPADNVTIVARTPAPVDDPRELAETAERPAIVTDPRLVASETVGQVRSQRKAQDDKTRSARSARGAGAAIPVAARSGDGTRRLIMIRPTSPQDALYYAARRNVAAINSSISR